MNRVVEDDGGMMAELGDLPVETGFLGQTALTGTRSKAS
jgi:hypothetical protein